MNLWSVLVLIAFWGGSATAAERKNVLFIAIDDLRPDIGAYNFSLAHTPNIDKLAKEGLTFKRAYAQQAYCGPSRSSILTGRRPDTTQVWNHHDTFREVGPHWKTLPGYFREHGYATMGSGKIFHPGLPKDNDYEQSWSHAWKYFSPECQPPKCPNSVSLPKHVEHSCKARVPEPSGTTVCEAEVAADESRLEHQLEDQQIRDNCIHQLVTAKEAGMNFFVACGFHKPHVPWIVPAEFWEYLPKKLDEIPLAKHPFAPAGMPDIAFQRCPAIEMYDALPFNTSIDEQLAREYRRAYYAAAAYTDYNVGKVLDALEFLGMRNNTIVLVFGDHGWHLGEQNEWSKQTNFELALRIPAIMRVPWLSSSHGRVSDALVEAVDLYPTLVELAGLPMEWKDKLNGTSLAPILKDPSRKTTKNAAYSQFAKRHRNEPYNVSPNYPKLETEVMGYSVRVDGWRYTAWFGVPPGQLRPDLNDIIATELYSHADDDGSFDFGGETVNVVSSSEHSILVQKLHGMVVEYVQIWDGDGNPTPSSSSEVLHM